MTPLNASDDVYGAFYCILMFLLPVARTLCEQVYFYYAQASGICIKGALATAVYRKTMRLSAAGGEGALHHPFEKTPKKPKNFKTKNLRYVGDPVS